MAPRGFLFSTAEAGIKKPGRKDLALIYSEEEVNIAGVFTTNQVKAAPVRLDMKRLKSGRGQAVVANSGNANACTGKKGAEDALEMTGLVAQNLHIRPSLVYAASTGVIGIPMPMNRIRAKIPELVRNLGKSTLRDAASAIMTTDTFPKLIERKIRIGSKTGVIAGICKGAGMICPNMATMLCFIMTDIAVAWKTLDKVLKESVKRSFNRITVDGDMSTNDTVLIMANGMLGNMRITEKSSCYNVFRNALCDLTYELSKLTVMDGEGATKFIEVEVRGARNDGEAEKAAFSVANSSLVKTAVYGNDANWGRIMAAVGYAGVKMKEEKTDIYLGKIKIAGKGTATGRDSEAGKYLKGKNIRIVVDLHLGRFSAKVLTCDLTEGYIRENASYRS